MTRTEFEDMVDHGSASDMEDIIQFMYECGYFDSSYNYDVVNGEGYAEYLYDEIYDRNCSSVSDIWDLMKWLENRPYPDETCYYYRFAGEDYSEVHNGDYEEIINDLRDWMDDRFDDEDDDYDDYDSCGDEDDDEGDCEVATVGMSYQIVLEQRADKQKTILSQIESLF